MHNRYQKPAELPPSFRFLQADLRNAQPTRGERLAEPEATEARRVEAVARLLALARAALLEGGNPDWLGAIPLQLRQFLTIAGLRILTADDPAAALRRFLGQKRPRRGRPAEDLAYRDFMIAADVAELHASGLTLNAAYEEVSKRPGTPGVREIERIYLRRDDLKIRAELELRRWPEENANDPPSEIESLKTITREQWEEYSALVVAECPNGMTVEDNLELWSFVRRASLPH
jgi:hypothetical protein